VRRGPLGRAQYNSGGWWDEAISRVRIVRVYEDDDGEVEMSKEKESDAKAIALAWLKAIAPNVKFESH
jgi:hypothetical protein